MVQRSTEENKPEITIGVLGRDGHGKTTLTAAITQSLARQNGSVQEGDEIVVDLGEYVEEDKSRPFVYETEARRYTHVDCHSHIDVMKNLILNCIPLQGAILVVSAVNGVLPRRESICALPIP
jgi:elongation factor Tu